MAERSSGNSSRMKTSRSKTGIEFGLSSSVIHDISDGIEFEIAKDFPTRTGATRIFGDEVSETGPLLSMGAIGENWHVPDRIVLGFDFYKLFFLNMDNRDFDVSVLQVIMSFQKLAKLLGLTLARDSIRGILSMHAVGSDTISWRSFLDFVMTFEKRQKFGAQRNRLNEHSDFLDIKKPTVVHLTFRERIFITMEEPTSSLKAQLISIIRVIVILLSTLGLVLESMPQFRHAPSDDPFGEPVPDESFAVIEALTIGFFTIDFFIRLCIVGAVRSEILDRQELIRMGTLRSPLNISVSPIARIANFLILPMSIVDIISIAPFFVGLVVRAMDGNIHSGGFRIARVIRLVGVLRLLRMKQFKDIQEILKKAFSNSMGALSILFFVFGIVVLFFSVIVFFPEGGTWYAIGSLVNGEVISKGAYYRTEAVDESQLELTPFTSIPASMWYSIISATTVGYGDMYPTTGWGKVVGVCLALTGIVVLAMPIAVVGSNFSAEYTKFYAIHAQLIRSKEADMHAIMMEKFHREHAEAKPAAVVEPVQPTEDLLASLQVWVEGDEVLMPILDTMRQLYTKDSNVVESVRSCLEIVSKSSRTQVRKTAIEKILFRMALSKLN